MISQRFVASLAIIASALTGCAVMKIDVDVYKGPLANHEEVQLEQMAVMAIGARPILMRLRDRLEDKKREDRRKDSKPWPIRETVPGYGTCIREEMKLVFESEDARRVNAILCLYEDRVSHLGKLHARAFKALRAYRVAWANFHGEGENRNWKAFKKAMFPEIISWTESSGMGDDKPLPSGHPLNTICSGENVEFCNLLYNPLYNLIEAYGQLLHVDGPEKTAAKSIWEAYKELVVCIDLLSSRKNRRYFLMNDFVNAEEYRGSNSTYRFLSNEKLVEAHAHLLFPVKAEKKKNEFVHTVTSIAKNFRTARESLRNLLQINLDMLIAFGQDSDSKSAQGFGRRARIADSIALLIGRANFRAIVKSVGNDESMFSRGLQEFAKLAQNAPGVINGNHRDLGAFKAFLISELTREPYETAVALREADLLFPSPSLPIESYDKADLNHLKNQARREFGLARVIHKGQEKPSFEKDIKELRENLGPAATGLAGGRLNDGLERMIDDYLKQDDSHKRHDGRDASVEIHRLRDALVRFAQKMLFVADYDSLLSRDNGKQSDDFDISDDPDVDKRIREYTQVLQAVGNSILLQANELQARKTHRKSLKDGVDRAWYGVSQVLDGTPQQTIGAVIDALEAERVDASKNLRKLQEELKDASTELREVATKLDPYVEELLPADETSPFPKPSELTDKADGPLELKKRQASDAENSSCDSFTAHVINVISARLTLTLKNDQKLYKDIRSHEPSISCNASLAEAKKLLNQTKEAQTHAERVQEMIQKWEPTGTDGKALEQNGPAVRKRIIDFLKKLQKEIADQEDPNYIRLKNVIAYLPTLELGAITLGKPLDVFNLMRKYPIGSHWKRVAKKLSDSFMSLKRARKAMQKEQNTLNGLKTSYRKKYEAFAQADKALKTLTAHINALKTTVAEIEGLKDNVVAKTLSAHLPNIPSATFLLLKATVKEKLEKAKIEKSKASEPDIKSKEKIVAKWKTVWNKLDGMNPPTSVEIARQSDFKNDETSREVLDRLISVLEYDRIETIKRYGTSGRAARVADALHAAYETRARLAFIRPASSYLRSSYPTASLQNDPALTWRNELKRHMLKSVPIFGGEITRSLDKHDIEPKVISQIDRQFWQNINSIRVGGAGRTNYVMVQDDIGNWYVKGYSANAIDIIKSAKGLGQFALGGQLGTDLVNRPKPGTGSASAPQPTALEAVFDKYKAEYERATEETFKEVKSALESLPSDVQDAWNKNSRTEKVRTEAVARSISAKTHLSETLTELNKDDSNKPEQVAQRPARIVTALRTMGRYHKSLEASIRSNILEDPPNDKTSANASSTTPEVSSDEQPPNTETGNTSLTPNAATNVKEERKTAINALIADLNEVVSAKIERFLKRREDTAKTYEKTIVFVGEIVGKAVAPKGETSTP